MFDPLETAAPVDTVEQPERRQLSERQADVMERLVAAAAVEAEARPYAGITVRTIAKRAGVAPATAYTYFSGKDHLLAEVLWRRAQSSPHLVDLSLPLPERVADTARTMGFGSMGSPAVTACTTALLGDGPDVKRVRGRASGPRSGTDWRPHWATVPTRRSSACSRSPTPVPSSAWAWATCRSTRCRCSWVKPPRS